MQVLYNDMIAAICFRVNDDYSAFIYPYEKYNFVDWERDYSCSLGADFSTFMFKNKKDGVDWINIVTGLDGSKVLRLTETKRYTVKIKSKTEAPRELPRLQNEDTTVSLNVVRDENSIMFQFVNYLGRSRITFPNQSGKRELVFEVVPDKMDYEDDYVNLTEALAERCAELLLDYSGPTSNVFSLFENESKTVLEQFIFLRQFCYGENIQSLFEAIKRNPDRILIEEEEFHPMGCGVPSKKYTVLAKSD